MWISHYSHKRPRQLEREERETETYIPSSYVCLKLGWASVTLPSGNCSSLVLGTIALHPFAKGMISWNHGISHWWVGWWDGWGVRSNSLFQTELYSLPWGSDNVNENHMALLCHPCRHDCWISGLQISRTDMIQISLYHWSAHSVVS